MYNGRVVNVVMPVYNEERTLREVVERVLKQKSVDRLIIVDDHSKDRSPSIMQQLARSSSRVTVIRNKENRGKGYSVRQGLRAVKQGIIIIQDADTEYFPEDYPQLLEKVDDKHAVFGVRVKNLHTGHTYGMAKFANAVMTGLYNSLYGQRIADINTCYKVFTKRMIDADTLNQDRFLGDMEIAIELARKGYGIREAPVRYNGRTYAEGKKITASDGIKMMFYIIGERFR